MFFAFRVAGRAGADRVLVLRQRWTDAWAWPLTVGLVAFAYAIAAVAGSSSPTHEYLTTAVLFVGAALTTATVLPVGIGAAEC